MSRENKRRSVNTANLKQMAEKSVNNSRVSYLKLPKGALLFKPDKDGVKRIDVLAYEIGKENYQTKAKPGNLVPSLVYYVHKGLGAEGNDAVICPKMMLGEPCPVCERLERNKKKGMDKDDYKEDYPKRRQLFNVIDQHDPDKNFVYDSPYPAFGQILFLGNFLDRKMYNMPEDDPRLGFANCEDGQTLEVDFKIESFNGAKTAKPLSVDFVSRKEDYPDSTIDDLVDLDSCLIIESYEDIEKLMVGADDIADDDPPRRGRAASDEDEKEEPKSRRRGEEKDDEEPPRRKAEKVAVEEKEEPRKSRRQAEEPVEEKEETKKSRKDEDEKPAKKVEPEDDGDDDPPPRRGRGSAVVEEDEKPAEEKEEPRKSRRGSDDDNDSQKCPFGHKFGIDADDFKDCDKCDKAIWAKCDDAQRALKK